MSILIDNKEIGKFSNSTNNVNVLSYKELTEVHDNIYLITTQNNQTFLKECKGTWKSKPIVEFNLHTGNKLFKNVQFILDKQKTSTINYEKYGVAAKKLIKEQPQPETSKQLVTGTTSSPVSSAASTNTVSIAEDKIKEYIEQSILNLLKDGDSKDQFAKFFDVYTEAFKRDIVKQTEKISRREMFRAMESGGGTNAVQYANGGTIDGNLIINGNLSAVNIHSDGGDIKGSNFIGDLFVGKMKLSSIEGDGAVLGQSVRWDGFNWTAMSNKAVNNVGNGVDDTFTITHGFSSLNVIHQVYDNTTNEVVLPFIQNIDANNTQIVFGFVPALTAYRVVTIT